MSPPHKYAASGRKTARAGRRRLRRGPPRRPQPARCLHPWTRMRRHWTRALSRNRNPLQFADETATGLFLTPSLTVSAPVFRACKMASAARPRPTDSGRRPSSLMAAIPNGGHHDQGCPGSHDRIRFVSGPPYRLLPARDGERARRRLFVCVLCTASPGNPVHSDDRSMVAHR